MKCSHLSVLVFAISLPACDPSPDTLHDESTGSDDWGMADEKIAIAPLEEIEDASSSETGRTVDPPEGQESESTSLSQGDSSSEEGSSSETSSGDEETGDETTGEGEETEESTTDTGDETGDIEEFNCDWDEYEAAETCRAAVRQPQDCSTLATAELEGDWPALECKIELDCKADQAARMMWEMAECMAPCRDSNPDEYLNYLCGAEQYIVIRECQVEQPCGVDNPIDDAKRECSTKGKFHHTQCMKTGELTEDPDWVVNPPTYECGVDEYTAAKSCESFYANKDNASIADCEKSSRNYARSEWTEQTGTEAPEEWIECELSRRCEWKAKPGNSLICASQCKNSHPENALHQECMVEKQVVLEECIRGTRIGSTSDFENGIECTDDASANNSRLSTCRSKADFAYGQCLRD